MNDAAPHQPGHDAGRILGIDYGTRRVGLAVSDPLKIIAQGIGTIANDAGLLPFLAGVVREKSIGLIVVGMPYTAEGGKGSKAREVDGFIEKLRRSVDIPVETWDESFTSVHAMQAFVEGGMKMKKRREKPRVDEMAARLMLQDYLESHDHR